MLKWIITFFCFFITGNLFAQQANLEIKGTDNNLYIDHSVASKESLYSIGRLFNISPKAIAAYNNMSLESGLTVGQILKVPLEKDNFTQTETHSGNEVLVPVYHTVAPSETLYRLGINYNKVPLASLKKWNHLSSDAVNVGTTMVVGFLKVDKNQSALANQQTSPVISTPTQPKENVVEPEKRAGIIVTKEPEVPKHEIAPAQNQTAGVTVTSVKTKSNLNFGGGYFKSLYEQQTGAQSPVKNSGTAGAFKSTSGWQDGKYYCFNDKAAPGTVIQITDVVSGKSVYAKVLDAIPEIKQNEGFDIIISNAAAEELGALENKFNCLITYVR